MEIPVTRVLSIRVGGQEVKLEIRSVVWGQTGERRDDGKDAGLEVSGGQAQSGRICTEVQVICV